MGRLAVVLVALHVVACQVCEHPGDACCEQARCGGGLICADNVCAEPSEVGSSCSSESDCISGWRCEQLSTSSERRCLCVSSKDVCDGKDNDCDGEVDGVTAEQSCETTQGSSAACVSSACVCLGTLCDGRCVDTDTDPANCGACENACSFCSLGRCVNRSLLQESAVGSPLGIAASAADVFWSDGRKVCRTGLETAMCTYVGEEEAMGEQYAPDALVVDGDDLFVTWAGHFEALSLSGGPSTVYAPENAVLSAFNSQRVFWSEAPGLFAAPRSGGAASLIDSGANPVAMAADEHSLFWLEKDGRLQAMPANGGDPITLVEQAQPGAWVRLAMDDDSLYWTSNAFSTSYSFVLNLPDGAPMTSRVMKVSKSGGTPVVLADSTPQSMIYGEVFVEGEYVYWTILSFGSHDSAIRRTAKSGGPTRGVVTAPFLGVTDFTLDPGGVDYISYDLGPHNLYRVPLP